MFSGRSAVFRRTIFVIPFIAVSFFGCHFSADAEDRRYLIPPSYPENGVGPPSLGLKEIMQCRTIREEIKFTERKLYEFDIEEEALAQHVSALRKQLGELSNKQANGNCVTILGNPGIFGRESSDVVNCRLWRNEEQKRRADLSFYTALWTKINELITSTEDRLRQLKKMLNQLGCRGEIA